MDLHDFYMHVLSDELPLRSYRELDPPRGEGLTPAQTSACR